MWKGLPRGAEEHVFCPSLGASSDTPANLVRCPRDSWGFPGISGSEIGKDRLFCPKVTSLERGVLDRAVPRRKLWLGSKVTSDLLSWPWRVRSCGCTGVVGGDTYWERIRRWSQGLSSALNPLLPSTSPTSSLGKKGKELGTVFPECSTSNLPM